MKKSILRFCQILLLMIICLIPLSKKSLAQMPVSGSMAASKPGFGFRVGLNYAKVSGSNDSIQYSYKPGLMISVFLAPQKHGVIGYRSELLYSKQGFDYSDAKGKTGTVSNDYLMIPQVMTLNITKYVQLQAGAFAGYLLKTKDSNSPEQNNNNNNNNDAAAAALSIMNRFDYGAAGGIEIYPLKGLIINARYNMGFAKLYKEQTDISQNNSMNYFNPFGSIDTKNGVIQFSAGYRF